MRKLFVAFTAALIVAAPALAEKPAQIRFECDGETYVYKVIEKGEATVISGRRYPSGAAFHLVVRNGMVRGTSGGWPVSFSLASMREVAPPERLAVR